MSSMTRDDLEQLAASIADKFINNNVSLEDSVLQCAKENSMNSDQIRRLVEMANTSTFLNMFQGKTGDDRMVEFKVADPGTVISRYYASTPEGSNPSISIKRVSSISTLDPSLDIGHSSFFDDIADSSFSTSKVASCCDSCNSECSCDDSDSDSELSIKEIFNDPSKKIAEYISAYSNTSLGLADKFRLNDIKESLLTKQAAFNLEAEDVADSIASEFKGLYSRDKHAEFEISALARHGNLAIPALQMVRNRLKMPKIARVLNTQELHGLKDRTIIIDSPSLSKLGEAVNAISQFSNITNGLRSMN